MKRNYKTPTTPIAARGLFYRRLAAELPDFIRCRGWTKNSAGEPGAIIFATPFRPSFFHHVIAVAYSSSWNADCVPRICLNTHETRLSASATKRFSQTLAFTPTDWRISDIRLELTCSIGELPGFASWIVDFIASREGVGAMPEPPYQLEGRPTAARLMHTEYEWSTAAAAVREERQELRKRSRERWRAYQSKIEGGDTSTSELP